MSINVIVHSGDKQDFNSLVYKPPTDSMINYYQNNLQSVLSTTSGFDNMFKENILAMYDSYNSEDVLANAKRTALRTNAHLSENIIQEQYVEDYNPNILMQKYIMACPEIYTAFSKQQIYGFGESYYNPDFINVGTLSNHYRSTMNGIMVEDEDGDLVSHQYSGSDIDNLIFEEKMAIINTWDSVKKMLNEDNIDPTDPINFK